MGDSTTQDSLAPVDVFGLTGGIKEISLGERYTCVLNEAGGVKCWGSNGFGQLGDSTTEKKLAPVDVLGLTANVRAIEAGRFHACAVTGTGGIKCWGRNIYGQLGDGTVTLRETPVEVIGLSGATTAVSAGDNQTCALGTNGVIFCWGGGSDNTLGNGVPAYFNSPQTVSGLAGPVDTIAAGHDHACVKTIAGGIQCWGRNRDGQLGDESILDRFNPVTVKGLGNGMSTVALGDDHSCAATIPLASNLLDMKCWGKNNKGQLGDGTFSSRNAPVSINLAILLFTPVVDGGGSHTCAIDLSFYTVLYCWGSISSWTPALIDLPGSGSISSVTAGDQHSCVVRNGALLCWGSNYFGQLGDNTYHGSETPVGVSGLNSGVQAVSAGSRHTCALTETGGVKCWGANPHGQLGDGSFSDRLKPVQVSGLTSGVKAIAAGFEFSCAILNDGSVKCWGQNTFGQLGNGSSGYSTQPVKVFGSVEGWRIFLPLTVRP